MPHYVCLTCGTDHPTSEGRTLCEMEHRAKEEAGGRPPYSWQSGITSPHPTYVTTMACETLSCKWRGYAITACKAEACGVRFEREAASDRALRELVDASAKGLSPDKMRAERAK